VLLLDKIDLIAYRFKCHARSSYEVR
jgi:hypothetical protein